MKLQQQFITQHKEHEPLSEKQCPKHKEEQYVADDAERANLPIRKHNSNISSIVFLSLV